jgi:hypothetical protein
VLWDYASLRYGIGSSDVRRTCLIGHFGIAFSTRLPFGNGRVEHETVSIMMILKTSSNGKELICTNQVK